MDARRTDGGSEKERQELRERLISSPASLRLAANLPLPRSLRAAILITVSTPKPRKNGLCSAVFKVLSSCFSRLSSKRLNFDRTRCPYCVRASAIGRLLSSVSDFFSALRLCGKFARLRSKEQVPAKPPRCKGKQKKISKIRLNFAG